MQISKPRFSIILDTRRIKKANLYPIKLRVTYAREQKYYSIGINLSKEHYETMQDSAALKMLKSISLKRELNQIKLKCDTIIVKANEIGANFDYFTYGLFEKDFFKQEFSRKDVYELYNRTILQIQQEGRIGTAASYQCSLSSLMKFRSKLTFRDISVEFLKNYEMWLLQNGKSITTVGVYLRPLRAILNCAITDGIVSRETNYPFGKRLYQIPATRNVKKALSKAEIKKIYDYQPLKGTWWAKAKDFFLFSYLSNGMNIKDILLLKRKNLDGEYLRFIRAKTMNTHKANITPISIFISPDLKRIIDAWESANGEDDDFLFPFISKGLTPEKSRLHIKQFTKMMNKHLLDIAKEVGIDKKVTTYFARHSFATILKKSGANIELIRESLGHTSSKTTATYLDSFDDDVKEGISKMLLDFS